MRRYARRAAVLAGARAERRLPIRSFEGATKARPKRGAVLLPPDVGCAQGAVRSRAEQPRRERAVIAP